MCLTGLPDGASVRVGDGRDEDVACLERNRERRGRDVHDKSTEECRDSEHSRGESLGEHYREVCRKRIRVRGKCRLQRLYSEGSSEVEVVGLIILVQLVAPLYIVLRVQWKEEAARESPGSGGECPRGLREGSQTE